MTINTNYMNMSAAGMYSWGYPNYGTFYNNMYVNNPFIINMQIMAERMAEQYKQMIEYTQQVQMQMAEQAKYMPKQSPYNIYTTQLFHSEQATAQTTSQQSAQRTTQAATQTTAQKTAQRTAQTAAASRKVQTQKSNYNKTSVYTAAKSTASKMSYTSASSSSTKGSKISRNNNQYGPQFLARVKQIAQRLNCNYRDLLAVMNAESGINASAKNPTSSASGLIQFIESTANSLGTTTSKLRAMSPIDQLDYVEKYLVRTKAAAGFSSNEPLSGGQLYALVFLPARAKRGTLTTSGESYYRANRGLDINKDGRIDKDELDQRIKRFYVSDKSFLA